MSNRMSQFARRRLRGVGLFAALLVWTMAAVEFGGNAGLWLYSGDEVFKALLDSFGQSSPAVLAAQFQPSTLSFMLVLILDFLPIMLSVSALFLLGRFFLRFSAGATWTQQNIRALWLIGWLCICTPIAYPVVETLQGLALSIDLPRGERILQISVGVSSFAAYEIVKGILLCLFSMLMHDAKVLNDEYNHYI